MGQFIELFKRYYLVFLFILLEFVAFSLLTRWNNYQRSVLYGITSGVNGSIHKRKQNIINYLALKGENERLRNENLRLRQENPMETMRLIFGDSIHLKADSMRPAFDVIPSTVMRNSFSQPKNLILISGGSNQGISTDDAVISSDGLVGLVVRTSANFSVVMPIVHEDFKLTPRINQKDFMGEYQWDSENQIATIQKLSKFTGLERGDTVYTGSASQLYPPNLPIGVIRELSSRSGSDFYEIQLELVTDFRKLQTVYVLVHRYKTEINQLMQP
jgi:rod shape-determining protein MreC